MNLNPKERFRIEELFFRGHARISEEDEHWIHGWDESESYCYPCAAKKVEELLKVEPDAEYCVDGGWGIEGDGTPFCETCHQLLSNTLTKYGCKAELAHFLDWSFNPLSHDDCRSMHEVIQSRGWEPWQDRPSDDDKAYFEALHKLCRSILDKHFWILPDNDFRHMWE